MYTLINILMFLIYYLNWYNIFSLLEDLNTAFFLFVPHSYKAVQQAVPLIAPHTNDKTLIMILKKNKCNVGKVFKM